MGFASQDVLKAAAPVRLGRVRLFPVVRTRVHVLGTSDRVTGNASRGLSAVVVRDETGERVLDFEGLDRSVSALRETAEGLGDDLDADSD